MWLQSHIIVIIFQSASFQLGLFLVIFGCKVLEIMKIGIIVEILVTSLLGFGSLSLGYLHNIIGTPFLYQPASFNVDPTAAARNGPAYQARYGYRGITFLEELNQKTVEGNPSLYDPKFIKIS